MASVETNDTGDRPLKKQKVATVSDSNKVEIQSIDSFENFEIISCINDKPREKVRVLHGKFAGSDEDAVVLLERAAFSEDGIRAILSAKSTLKNTLQNNIYGTYDLLPPPEESSQ